MSLGFEEIEHAACDVIQIIKQIPELGHTRLSVIGGLALWHYLPDYRPTDNINFVTNISTSPSSVKKKLLDLPSSPFVQRAQVLYYQSPAGRDIQVNICPEWLCPYFPESAQNIRRIPYGTVPYIALADLVVFKLDSSGLRSNLVKKERDARDAAALVEHELEQQLRLRSRGDGSGSSGGGHLALGPRQEEVVEEALCDVARCGTKDKAWWERSLGLSRTGTTPPPPSSSNTTTTEWVDNQQKQQQRGIIGGVGGSGRRRPHANSDSSYGRVFRGFSSGSSSGSSGSAVVEDPSTAWHYAVLDTPIRRFASLSLHGGRKPSSSSSSSSSSPSSASSRPRKGLARASSWGYGAVAAPPPSSPPLSSSSPAAARCMTQPKTTAAAVANGKRSRAASAASSSADSGYFGGGELELCGDGRGTEFDCDGPLYYLEPLAGNGGGLDTVTEHHHEEFGQQKKRTSPTPKTPTPPPVRRSVTFQL
ncbi:hypothetical protein GGR56DRAFT_683756 [Xylariaceae sp. FL0804]|nr:hypothetical protein GGR56DRAFT_683756 [Xylariaceae sp. FL0804]